MVAVALDEGLSAAALRAAAAAAKDANQARRLLALAAVRDGVSREAAARLGGMDRQTLRDWVHAFNAGGIGALTNDTSPGCQRRSNFPSASRSNNPSVLNARRPPRAGAFLRSSIIFR